MGGRPKNRRWNTWRPDEEDHTPVAPAALQCHPVLSTSCLALSCDILEQRQAMAKANEKAEIENKAKQFFWSLSAPFPFYNCVFPFLSRIWVYYQTLQIIE